MLCHRRLLKAMWRACTGLDFALDQHLMGLLASREIVAAWPHLGDDQLC